MAKILHQLIIKAEAKSVYKALTEKNGLAGWWTKDVKAEPIEESVADFKFGNQYFIQFRIVSLSSSKNVLWTCINGDKEWIGTDIKFELAAQGHHTLLKFSHDGWKNATDFYAHCNYNWGWYLASLKEYCEKGKGKPYQDRDEI